MKTMLIGKKRTFMVTVTLLLVAGFLAVNVMGYLISIGSLRSQVVESSLPLTSDNIYSEIQRDLLQTILISSLMASDTFLRDWVLAGERDTRFMVKYLTEIKNRFETVSCFFVSEKTRHYYHHQGVLKTVLQGDVRDMWYFRVREMNKPFEINVEPDLANRDALTIFINYRVLDYDGQFIGATGVGLTIRSVTDLIDSYRKRFKREIYFVDQSGRIVLSGRESWHRGDENASSYIEPEVLKRVFAGNEHSFFYQRNGETVLLDTRFIPEFKWYLMVEQRDQVADQTVRHTFLINLIICLMITALVLFLAQRTLSSYQHRLEQMATIDKLTGVFNRQSFEFLFSQLIGDLPRRPQQLSLIMLDIDHFKAVNDSFGHQVGDFVLSRTVETMAAQVRSTDVIGRWGGEEFLILLKECDADHAMQTAEKIRESIATLNIIHERKTITITVSLGVVSYREPLSHVQFIALADQALYRAKNLGRNRCEAG